MMSLSVAGKRVLRVWSSRSFVALGLISTFAILICGDAGAQTAAEIIAPEGCAMAHCDQGLSDNVHLLPPSEVVEAWRDTTVNGSSIGLGCVSNGETVVCSFRSSSSKPVEIRAYEPDGDVLWSSTALSSNAFYSAPVIGPNGGVVAADSSRIIRFDPLGQTVWSQSTAGGSPISPNITDNGEIILATLRGPVSAYDFETGDLIAQLRLSATMRVSGRQRSGYFDTINTPAIRGQRIYISTQFRYGFRSSNIGRLYALDLVRDGDGTYSLEIAWYFSFQAPSGTSPTLGRDEEERTVIYFDGSGVSSSSGRDPQAFAVRDTGTSGELLWRYALPTVPQSSPAVDPRGGIWYYAPGNSQLLRLSESSGELLQSINLNSIVADNTGTFIPVSVMTISGEAASPVMVVSAAASNFSKTYVTAIDLAAGSLLWKFRVDEGRGFSGVPSGQFPMLLDSSGGPVVVFSTNQNGVWALTAP